MLGKMYGVNSSGLKSPRQLEHKALPSTTLRDNPLALQQVRKTSGPLADPKALLPCAPWPL